jgi:beta-galactosidase
MKKIFLTLMFFALVLPSLLAQQKHTFSIADGNFLLDGKPTQIHSGEMHYSRIP